MARLRQAFTEAHALQCGYCTPGMLIAARDLVRRKGGLSRGEIRTEMSGNLCRCTGYHGHRRRHRARDGREVTSPSPRASSARREGRLQTPEQAAAPHPNPLPAEEWGEEIRAAPAAAARRHLAGAGARSRRIERSQRRPPPSHPPAPRAAPPLPPRSGARGTRAPIRVTVGQPEEAGGETRLTQSFVLQHPRAAVWQLMSDVEAVARCMPGALARWPTGRRQSVGPARGEDRPDRGKLCRRGHAAAVRGRVPPGHRGPRRRPAQRLARLGQRRLPADRARRRAGRGEQPASTSSSATRSPARWPRSAAPAWCAISCVASARRSRRTSTPSCTTPRRTCRRRSSAGCRCCCRSSATGCAPFSLALAAAGLIARAIAHSVAFAPSSAVQVMAARTPQTGAT